MELSSALVKEFASAVNDTNEEVTSSGTAYGTIVSSNGVKYVLLDGASSMTAISEATDAWEGDRVIVTITNHVATVTSNLTSPASGRTATAVSEELTAYYDYIDANYITADKIEANYATYNYLTTNYLDATQLEAEYATIKYLDSTFATIQYLESEYITAEEITTQILEAEEGLFEYVNTQIIEAQEGYFEYLDVYYLTAEYIEATYIEWQEAYGAFAQVDDLEVIYANISNLDADIANITNLLAGNAGVGDLQTIYLTADNVVIDSAVIEEALIGTVLADIITSNVIYTDYIRIANNEGQNFLIDGATLQINDGVAIRVQIGLDADGNYNFYLFNESGDAIWDALGLTEAGLIGNGAIIRDVAVADDANISGYKLNIDEVTQILNANGELVLEAAQVTIDGQTLDYKLTEITQSAVKQVINYYAIGVSPDYPPCDPGDTIYDAICGIAICGLSYVGTIGWTTRRLQADDDGEYLWYVQKLIYADGSESWTEPTCITDDYIRTKTSTLTTELEVVQGQISAKIWQTDIEEATNALGDQIVTISDQYSDLTITINEIDEQVSTLTTTVGSEFQEMYGLLSDINIQLGDITLTVSGFYDYVNEYYLDMYEIVSGIDIQLGSVTTRVEYVESEMGDVTQSRKAYYAISYSPDYYPTHGGNTIAICGLAVCGLAICGNTGVWTDTRPEAKEGEYIWLSYFVTNIDGTTYWEDPILLSDEVARDQITEVNKKYSEISVALESIDLTVYSLENNMSTALEQITQINMTLGSMSLSVYDSDNGMASIVMTVGDTVEIADVVTNARKAFANDNSEITISAGKVTFNSGTFVVNSEYFSVTEDGVIDASSGKIGNWTITTNSIQTGSYDTSGTMYFGTSGLSLGKTFKVTSGGELTASSGTIGGFTITSYKIYGHNTDDVSEPSSSNPTAMCMQIPGTNRGTAFAAGGTSHSNYSDAAFRVDRYGTLYTTDIEATGGTIGGWTISSSKIYNKGGESNGTAVMQMPSSSVTYVFAAGGSDHSSYSDCPFKVTKAGALTAKDATIANGLYFATWNTLTGESGKTKAFELGDYGYFEFLIASEFQKHVSFWTGIGVDDGITSDTLETTGNIYCGNAMRFTSSGSSYSDPSTGSPNARFADPGSSGTSRLCLCTGSSIRYKNVIQNVSDHDISSLFSIPVVWFKYKDSYLSDDDERYEKEIPGFITEDWEDVLPIAVDHRNGVPEIWNSNIVVPLTFAMVKYTQSEIEDVQDRIDVLQLEIDQLKEENTALKQELADIKAA